MYCPLCGKEVEAGQSAEHGCEPLVEALVYTGARGRMIVYHERYGWRLQRGRLVLRGLDLVEAVRLILDEGFVPRGNNDEVSNSEETSA